MCRCLKRPKLELQAVVSHVTWVPEVKLCCPQDKSILLTGEPSL